MNVLMSSSVHFRQRFTLFHVHDNTDVHFQSPALMYSSNLPGAILPS